MCARTHKHKRTAAQTRSDKHTIISNSMSILTSILLIDLTSAILRWHLIHTLDSFVNVRLANSLQSIIGYLITTIARLEFNIIGRLSFAMLHGVHADHVHTQLCTVLTNGIINPTIAV